MLKWFSVAPSEGKFLGGHTNTSSGNTFLKKHFQVNFKVYTVTKITVKF